MENSPYKVSTKVTHGYMHRAKQTPSRWLQHMKSIMMDQRIIYEKETTRIDHNRRKDHLEFKSIRDLRASTRVS